MASLLAGIGSGIAGGAADAAAGGGFGSVLGSVIGSSIAGDAAKDLGGIGGANPLQSLLSPQQGDQSPTFSETSYDKAFPLNNPFQSAQASQLQPTGQNPFASIISRFLGH